MIDLRRLQVLRVIHQSGTVTAAARALHLTPSAVSQQIRQLARDLGVELLQPQGRGVRLTAAAHALLSHADDLNTRWERIHADLQSYADGEAGTLRIASFPSALVTLAVPAAARLRETAPRLTVQIAETETLDAFQQLLAGQTDLAIVVPTSESPDQTDPRFDLEMLLDQPLDLLVAAEHPLARRERVDLTDAAAESWVLAGPGECDHYQTVVVACTTAGFSPRIAHRAKEWSAIAALVAGGFGVSLVPRMVTLGSDLPVARVSLADHPTPTRRVLTAVRSGSRTQPLIAKGLDALAATARAHRAETTALTAAR